MKIKKIIWWAFIIVFVVVSLSFLLVSFGIEETQDKRFSTFGEFIYDNQEQWQDVNIDGENIETAFKHLCLSSGLAIEFSQLSAYLLLVLLAFIAITNIYKKFKKKTAKSSEESDKR